MAVAKTLWSVAKVIWFVSKVLWSVAKVLWSVTKVSSLLQRCYDRLLLGSRRLLRYYGRLKLHLKPRLRLGFCWRHHTKTMTNIAIAGNHEWCHKDNFIWRHLSIIDCASGFDCVSTLGSCKITQHRPLMRDVIKIYTITSYVCGTRYKRRMQFDWTFETSFETTAKTLTPPRVLLATSHSDHDK